jgi:hypothetical protein
MERKRKKRKKILETYRSLDYDTINTVRKIFIRRKQHHQERSLIMISVDQTCRLKAKGNSLVFDGKCVHSSHYW